MHVLVLEELRCCNKRQTDEHARRDRLAASEEEQAEVEEVGKKEAVLKCEQQVLLQAVTFKLRFCKKIQTFWNTSHCIIVDTLNM